MITLGVTVRWEKSFVCKKDSETNKIETIPFNSPHHSLISGLEAMFTEDGDIYNKLGDDYHSENNELYLGFAEDFMEEYVVDENTLCLPVIYTPHVVVYQDEAELKEKVVNFMRKYLDYIARTVYEDDMIDEHIFSRYEIVSIDYCDPEYIEKRNRRIVQTMSDLYYSGDISPKVADFRLRNDLYKNQHNDLPIRLQKNKRFMSELELLKSVKNDFYRGVPTAYIVEVEDSLIVSKEIADIMIEKKMLLSKYTVGIVLYHRASPTTKVDNIMYSDGNICYIQVGKVIETSSLYDADSEYYITKSELKHYFSGGYSGSNRAGIIRKYSKDTLIFFEVNSKATEDTLLKICEECNFNVKTLCPDAFTDKDEIKSIFDEYAKKDHFEEYTGEIRNSPYMIGEIRQEYERWKYGKLFELVGGKSKEDATKETDLYCLDKLNNLIGLGEVKESVTKIINAFRMQKLYKEKGIINETPSRHMVFYGSPGTAKTTVARLIGDILKLEGILSSGQFVEVGREDLVGEYVGQTAPKTKKAFKRAKGGILFIDEAYSLMTKDSYGAECIATIVKEMENNREDTIVIFAGYQDKMKDFVDFNEGMKSRIAFHLKFDDYTVDELMEINDKILKEQKFSMDEKALEKTRKLITSRIGSKNFGNGRFVRSLIEQSIINLSDRLVKTDRSVSDMEISELTTITGEDISDMNEIDKIQHNIGFGSVS